MQSKTGKKKKYGVHRKGMPFISLRNDLVQAHVAAEIRKYLGGDDRVGTCLVCNTTFEKRHRWHSLCGGDCAHSWNLGQIHPRSL